MQHILTSDQFSYAQLDDIWKLTERIAAFCNGDRSQPDPELSFYSWDEPGIPFKKLLGTIFCQPSTRTRCSLQAACLRLGGSVVSIDGTEASSLAKGESWEDTIVTLSQYYDVLAIRSGDKHHAKQAAAVSDTPIINCGSGSDEHPTQALLDLYTIRERKPLDGLNIVIFGDIEHARTIKSFKKMIGMYDVNISEFSLLKKRDDPLDDMTQSFKEADVVYITRMQREYHGKEIVEFPGITTHSFTEKTLSLLKEDAIILHPGPVVGEVAAKVKQDPRWVYKQQVKNGMYIRMALLKLLTGHI